MDEARRKQVLGLALRNFRGTLDEILTGDAALQPSERQTFERDLADTEELIKELDEAK